MKKKTTINQFKKTKMKKLAITKNTNLNELIIEKPELVGILLSSGMGCMGCPMARMETIEDGCRAHGMNDKEISKFVERLNQEDNPKPKSKTKAKIKNKINLKRGNKKNDSLAN